MIEKKKQIKRPLIIYIIIIAYVIAPFANIALLMIFGKIPLNIVIERLFKGYGVLASIWLLTAPFVGIGFYFIHKISWYVFLGHSLLILIDYVFKWISRPSYYWQTIGESHNLFMMAGNLVLVIAIGYILRKNFRSPYFQVLPRSWRESERIPINHWIIVNDQECKLTDISEGGCFVVRDNQELHLGERANLKFESDKLKIECEGQVMREIPNGYGMRFVALPLAKRRDIRNMLKKRFSLRYQSDIECSWEQNGYKSVGRVVNVSKGGCFVKTDVDDLSAETICRIYVDEFSFTASMQVIWINSSGLHDKPIGFGAKLIRGQGYLLRKIKKRYGNLRLTR